MMVLMVMEMVMLMMLLIVATFFLTPRDHGCRAETSSRCGGILGQNKRMRGQLRPSNGGADRGTYSGFEVVTKRSPSPKQDRVPVNADSKSGL